MPLRLLESFSSYIRTDIVVWYARATIGIVRGSANENGKSFFKI